MLATLVKPFSQVLRSKIFRDSKNELDQLSRLFSFIYCKFNLKRSKALNGWHDVANNHSSCYAGYTFIFS